MQRAAYRAADATTLAGWVARGEATPGALLVAALREAEAASGLGAICQLLPQLAEAALPGVDPAAPFAGVPFLIKDLGSPLAGAPTFAGSHHLQSRATPAVADGELVARFKAAGLVPFGKTTVPEFGMNLASEPAAGPLCRNPWNQALGAGGSSGGAAAAVAAGIVPMAHATDAGGSIRVPAAWCGLVGLKPSRGAIPQGPDFTNLLGGLASELVVSRTVRDTARALAVAVLPPVDGPYLSPLPHGYAAAALDRPPGPQRIALAIAAPDGSAPAPAWAAAAESAARLLQAAGHGVEPLDPRALSGFCTQSRRAFAQFACRNLAAVVDMLSPAPDGIEPMSWAAARKGAALQPRDFVAQEVALARSAYEFARLQRRIGILLTPTVSGPPPPLGTLRTDGGDLAAHFAAFAALAPYAALANATGCPAIAVPHGHDADGLPCSVQLLGPPGSEAVLLSLARQLEQAAPWQLLAGSV